ncbi:MAG: hypothetical protein WCI89_00810 [bacterium]
MHTFHQHKKNASARTAGFAMLIAVLSLAVVGVAVSTTLLLLSIAGAQTTLATQESAEAKTLASTCAELGLQKLVTSSAFVGTGNLTVAQQGSCAYTVAQINASNDKINATGTVNQTSRKVQVVITIPNLVITSWQEVGDFP